MTHPTSPPTIQRIRNWLRSDMRILRWVFLALYVLVVVGLSAPFFFDGDSAVTWAVLAGVMLLSQALFIFGAGTIRLCHPIKKRRLWMPVLAASFMLCVLATALFLALAELTYMDKNISDAVMTSLFFATIAVSWIGWAVILWQRARDAPRHTALAAMAKLIFAGSLAELLAAIPSHLVVSKRPGCLVGLSTMIGILAGLYVMLFAFGPAIVLLFLRPRYRRERMESSACAQCFYNLTGTLAAGGTTCPECGRPIHAT